MGKISSYGNDNSPATTDYVLGNQASGPSTVSFLLSKLITLFFNNIPNSVIAANNLATNAITLGYAQITSNFVTSNTTATQVTGLTLTVTIPAGGRRIRITFHSGVVTATANIPVTTIWDGVVGSGTQLDQTNGVAGSFGGVNSIAVVCPAAGSKTYNAGFHVSSTGTGTIEATSTQPAFILVEMI